MTRINVIGSIFGITGYDIHTRKLSNALHELGMDVSIHCPKIPQWERFVNDAELNMLTKDYDANGITLMISQPQSWDLALCRKPKRFWGFCVWEGDKIPEYWLKYLLNNKIEYILVPSQHTKDAIIKATDSTTELEILHDKIKIIPHGYDNVKLYPDKKQDNDNFVFIANKGWNRGLKDRGGMQWLIKAYCEEFTNKDKVELRLKINSSYNDANWNLKQQIKELNVDNRTAPILSTTENLDEDALREFYNEGDVFISTSMAEAFNLPCIEAMGCGLPVITTSFGGQSDYVDNENGWIINEGKFEYWSDEIIYEETKWFVPDINAIRARMRDAYDNWKTPIFDKKKEKALKMASKYTWKESAKKLIKLI